MLKAENNVTPKCMRAPPLAVCDTPIFKDYNRGRVFLQIRVSTTSNDKTLYFPIDQFGELFDIVDINAEIAHEPFEPNIDYVLMYVKKLQKVEMMFTYEGAVKLCSRHDGMPYFENTVNSWFNRFNKQCLDLNLIKVEEPGRTEYHDKLVDVVEDMNSKIRDTYILKQAIEDRNQWEQESEKVCQDMVDTMEKFMTDNETREHVRVEALDIYGLYSNIWHALNNSHSIISLMAKEGIPELSIPLGQDEILFKTMSNQKILIKMCLSVMDIS